MNDVIVAQTDINESATSNWTESDVKKDKELRRISIHDFPLQNNNKNKSIEVKRKILYFAHYSSFWKISTQK